MKYFMAGLLLCNLAAVAQNDTTMHSLDEVVVTAQRIDRKNLELPYAVEKITHSYLQQYSPQSTAEALQGINGVFVQKTNHGGGSPFVRGLTGNQTLMLVDGEGQRAIGRRQ